MSFFEDGGKGGAVNSLAPGEKAMRTTDILPNRTQWLGAGELCFFIKRVHGGQQVNENGALPGAAGSSRRENKADQLLRMDGQVA